MAFGRGGPALALTFGPVSASPEAEAAPGRALFNARGCAECHPCGSRGDPTGHGLVLRLPDNPVLGRL